MLTVIKRSGREEPFDREKLKKCLALTSDEAGQPLTEGDLYCIIQDVELSLQQSQKVYYHEISRAVIGALVAHNFYDMARTYNGFVSSIA